MNSRIPLRTFNDERFLRELHHLLWTPPQLIGTTMDAGWGCRDHALMVGILLESFGHKAMLIHGEALFVRGPTGRAASICYTQRPHNWLLVEGAGAVDLSIKPEFDSSGERIRFPLHSVFANQWIPRGKGRVFFIDDAASFALAETNLPQQRNHATAVYLTREAEHIHQGHITHSAGWIGSALTRMLDTRYGNPVALYAALLLHLHAFVAGHAAGLSALPFDESWDRLAAQQEGAVARATRLLDNGGAPPSAESGATQDPKATRLQTASRRCRPSL